MLNQNVWKISLNQNAIFLLREKEIDLERLWKDLFGLHQEHSFNTPENSPNIQKYPGALIGGVIGDVLISIGCQKRKRVDLFMGNKDQIFCPKENKGPSPINLLDPNGSLNQIQAIVSKLCSFDGIKTNIDWISNSQTLRKDFQNIEQAVCSYAELSNISRDALPQEIEWIENNYGMKERIENISLRKALSLTAKTFTIITPSDVTRFGFRADSKISHVLEKKIELTTVPTNGEKSLEGQMLWESWNAIFKTTQSEIPKR